MYTKNKVHKIASFQASHLNNYFRLHVSLCCVHLFIHHTSVFHHIKGLDISNEVLGLRQIRITHIQFHNHTHERSSERGEVQLRGFDSILNQMNSSTNKTEDPSVPAAGNKKRTQNSQKV